ncbi:uncharacterized protein E0L32_009216 [Thyridium curvatum]|uniref:Sulfhydryl oxidase n=1 Tax=Thyridium curvatum TaxID=1093900 RepID=A0A507AHV5_9PEZI|nr:uncharacterized protein E0L32_009216 [Thyridium curvatum]TPX09615.1 hypothetical protein E0L32_009216 [Thyridium curvatum]
MAVSIADDSKAAPGAPVASSDAAAAATKAAAAPAPKQHARPLILGPDGKPCRSCNSFAAFTSQSKALQAKTGTATEPVAARGPPADCPADVETLGRSSWTLLHTIAAQYPETPSAGQQSDIKQFMGLFSRLYPCWVCAEDFQAYLRRDPVRAGSRGEFGKWLCDAHNDVNKKLGKPIFDCGLWEQRWRTGWKDGRCD